MPRKSIAEQSPDTRVLVSEISRMPRGSNITYAEHFSRWLGRKIGGRDDMPTFASVERILNRDYDIHLSVIRGIGYHICTHQETVNDRRQIQRARQAARKRKKELNTVNTTELDEVTRSHYYNVVTQAHLAEEVAKDRAVKKIAAANNGYDQPLALAKAFDAIKGNV